MAKTEKIKEYVTKRISQIDLEYEKQNDNMKKLKLSTMRTSFANILNVYLNEEGELGMSYFKHAQTYAAVGSYEQAIFYSALARKNLKQPDLIEDAIIINLTCLIKACRFDQAHDHVQNLSLKFRNQEFLIVKAEIYEQMKDQEKTFQCLNELQNIIESKYGKKSVKMGLFLVEKGKKKGVSEKYQEALKLYQQGMDILIDTRYKQQSKTSKIYLQMAKLCKKLKKLDSEYSFLVCAFSMLKQVSCQQKQMIQTLHKIVSNLFEREQYQACLKELFKIQVYEKQVYGQSSLVVGKTIKKINQVLLKLNRKMEAKKYELQYSRIIGCNDKKGMARDKPLKFSQVKASN